MGVDILTREHRSWNMGRIQGKDTLPEMVVRRILHYMGYRFRLHCKHLPGCPDIVMSRFRVAIFVHGCFWHRHVKCFNCTTPTANRKFWLEKFRGNIERDKRNLSALKRAGWRVLVVWECQIADMAKIKRRLARFMDYIPKKILCRN